MNSFQVISLAMEKLSGELKEVESQNAELLAANMEFADEAVTAEEEIGRLKRINDGLLSDKGEHQLHVVKCRNETLCACIKNIAKKFAVTVPMMGDMIDTETLEKFIIAVEIERRDALNQLLNRKEVELAAERIQRRAAEKEVVDIKRATGKSKQISWERAEGLKEQLKEAQDHIRQIKATRPGKRARSEIRELKQQLEISEGNLALAIVSRDSYKKEAAEMQQYLAQTAQQLKEAEDKGASYKRRLMILEDQLQSEIQSVFQLREALKPFACAYDKKAGALYSYADFKRAYVAYNNIDAPGEDQEPFIEDMKEDTCEDCGTKYKPSEGYRAGVYSRCLECWEKALCQPK